MAKRNQQFQTIRTEGALLPPDVLQSIASLKVDGTSADSYHLPPGTKINEAISQSWNALKQHWAAFKEARGSLGKGSETETGTSATNSTWLLPLFKELDYGRLVTSKSPVIDDRTYPIERFYNHTPIHLVGCLVPLDRRTKGARGAATASPHSMVQEYLNRSKDHLWAFLSNGLQLRILRDNISLSRQAFIEFDLESMMEGEVYADFAILWLLCHQSRVESDKTTDSWLEKWSKLARDQGTRVLEDLRNGVAAAIEALGQGFIAHPNNETLRERLRSGELSKDDYYRQILRVVYRMLFLFVAEDRDLLHPPLPDGEGRDEAQKARSLYDDYYSTRRLRDLAFRVRGTRHSDLWHSLSLVFDALGSSACCPQLALTGFGSFLWRDSAIPDLLGPTKSSSSTTNSYSLISNEHLLRAIRSLAYIEKDRVVRVVDYRNLGTEELGSVYESLLELHPEVHIEAKGFELKVAAGNERKTSGSYYTPDSLVQCLLDSALEPVVSERLAEARERALLKARNEEDKIQTRKEFLRALDNNTELARAIRQEAFGSNSDQLALSISLEKSIEAIPLPRRNQLLSENAILGMKVCDPACGSGHFLIAAAHRLARHLARVRTGEVEPTPDEYQRALRDVIGRCIYGVDINPMAVELCKVSLWMEAIEPSKPLSFLDHHIQCGNSLLGTTPKLQADGIPNEAFTAIEGDDKKVVKSLKAENKRERDDRASGQLSFFDSFFQLGNLPSVLTTLNIANDDTVDDVVAKERRYAEVVAGADYLNARLLADLWCAVFVWKKDESDLGRLCPTERQFRQVEGNPHSVHPAVKTEIRRLAIQLQFFHWHLAFPDVFHVASANSKLPSPNSQAGWIGGFDVVLGNPPWEKIHLRDEEFFAERHPEIALAPTKAQRKKMIENLCSTDPTLFAEYEQERDRHERISAYFRVSGYFPMTGVSRINLYSVFCETGVRLIAHQGRLGLVLASGLLTDDNNKDLFSHLVTNRQLAAAWDFENSKGIFPEVHRSYKFALLTCAGSAVEISRADFAFYLTAVDDLSDFNRHFALSPEDFTTLNPNTRACPTFRNKFDALVTLAAYKRTSPVCLDSSGHSGWPGTIKTPFNSANDSVHFKRLGELREAGVDCGELGIAQIDGVTWLPIYEPKFIHQFDHRFATRVSSEIADTVADVDFSQHVNPGFSVNARFWMTRSLLQSRFPARWYLVLRNITGALNERTSIAAVIPERPCVDANLITDMSALFAALACANMNSFVYDYFARQKIAGVHFNQFIWKQIPLISPKQADHRAWTGFVSGWLRTRVLELTYTAYDLEPFARDCGYDGPPLRWDEQRRILLRAELDAAFFHLYLPSDANGTWKPAENESPEDLARLKESFPTPRHAVDYIMETFPIVKRKDIARTEIKNDSGEVTQPGRYITKDTILEIYDQMQQAIDTGHPYQTRLNPPPGPPTGPDGNFIPTAQWDASNWPSHIHPLRQLPT